MNKKISSALISVFYKDGLEPVVRQLQKQGITIYSTGGTQKFIEELGINVIPVKKILGIVKNGMGNMPIIKQLLLLFFRSLLY
jgi:AICAR transformylase/IMP cyclohydrolase PurH